MPIDWSDYECVHSDRRNLLIHLLAVPLFGLSFPAALWFLASGRLPLAAASMVAAVAGMTLQGFGHSREAVAPKPFGGAVDFLRRWFTEQYVTFPLFVLSGRWSARFRKPGNRST